MLGTFLKHLSCLITAKTISPSISCLLVALMKNIILEFTKCFNMDSSFPSRGAILRPHDISDMILGFFLVCFCHLPTFEFVLLKQSEAWSKWRDDMMHRAVTGGAQVLTQRPLSARLNTLKARPLHCCHGTSGFASLDPGTGRAEEASWLRPWDLSSRPGAGLGREAPLYPSFLWVGFSRETPTAL